MSIFYFHSIPNKKKSAELAKEALIVVLPLYEQIPSLEDHLKTAIQLLRANSEDFEELLNFYSKIHNER